MKDKFFKFFEIGKLDKGLFRIWVVLAIVWIAFMYFEVSQYHYKGYQKEKLGAYSCFFLEDDSRFYMTSSTKGAAGTNRQWFYREGFDTMKACKKVAYRDRNDFYLGIVFTILAPFFLILIWLFGKKMTLWIYRGFK